MTVGLFSRTALYSIYSIYLVDKVILKKNCFMFTLSTQSSFYFIQNLNPYIVVSLVAHDQW